LLSQGAKVNGAYYHGGSALENAVSNGHCHLIKVLLEKGAKIERRGPKPCSYTPLMQAAALGLLDCVKILVHNGASITAKSGHCEITGPSTAEQLALLYKKNQWRAVVAAIDAANDGEPPPNTWSNRAPGDGVAAAAAAAAALDAADVASEEPAPGPAPMPRYPQPGPFLKGMQATHFWDCEAGICDSSVLQPFVRRKAVQSPANAPADPSEHGGAIYGEKLWMTGAPSDAMSRYMGPNLLGMSDQYDGKCGGCGQCLLVKNPDSKHPDWTVVVMKKVRCHPANPKCSGEQRTVDFAVPSFDNLQYSLANRCGKVWSDNTFITREQSGTCGALHSPQQCDCTHIPNASPELNMMRRGCELFKEWGWNTGVPTNMEYTRVECPQRMVDRFSGHGGINAHGAIALFDAGAGNMTALTPPALPAGSFLTQPMILLMLTMCSLLVFMGLLLLALRRGRHEVLVRRHLLHHQEPESQQHFEDDLSS
jgi:hypothetical protein